MPEKDNLKKIYLAAAASLKEAVASGKITAQQEIDRCEAPKRAPFRDSAQVVPKPIGGCKDR